MYADTVRRMTESDRLRIAAHIKDGLGRTGERIDRESYRVGHRVDSISGSIL